MDYHNEYGFQGGPYQHHKGVIFVALDLITHAENATTGDMEKLGEPEVIYRDLEQAVEHVEGKLIRIHRRYRMKLSEWRMLMPDGTKRFTQI